VSAGQAEVVTDNPISMFLFSDNCPVRKVFVPDPIISATLLCSGLDTPWLYSSTFMPISLSARPLFPQTRLPALPLTSLLHSLAEKDQYQKRSLRSTAHLTSGNRRDQVRRERLVCPGTRFV
jgi:hypothetical protein